MATGCEMAKFIHALSYYGYTGARSTVVQVPGSFLLIFFSLTSKSAFVYDFYRGLTMQHSTALQYDGLVFPIFFFCLFLFLNVIHTPRKTL